jgi:hypothetical protein
MNFIDEECKEEGRTHRAQAPARKKKKIHECERKRSETEEGGSDSGKENDGAAANAQTDPIVLSSSDSDKSSNGPEIVRQLGKKGKRGAKGSFRMQGKEFAITYPRCELEQPEFQRLFIEVARPDRGWVISRERHEDGGHHWHAYAAYSVRRNLQRATVFDLTHLGKTYHPNIQKVKKAAFWLEYIKKDGQYWKSALIEPNLDIVEYGKKQKTWQDFQWYSRHLDQRARSEVAWPVKLACEGGDYTMERPDPKIKKRSWWIVAAPNSGKTRWINATFGMSKVYVAAAGDFPYEQYAGEELCIYDDRQKVTFEELSGVLNTYQIHTQVPGKARYVPVYWPLNATRSIIFLTNTLIEDYGFSIEHIAAMKKRFIQIVNPVLKQSEDSEEEKEVAQPNLDPIGTEQPGAFAEFVTIDE